MSEMELTENDLINLGRDVWAMCDGVNFQEMGRRFAERIAAEAERYAAERVAAERAERGICSDCPPLGYPTDKTRCESCPRRLPTQPGEVTP